MTTLSPTAALKFLGAIALLAGTATANGQTDPNSSKNEMLVASIHAQGAQVYECKVNASHALAWQFREPIATLIENGSTVGRHYAGPHWELSDGSNIVAKVTGRTPGRTSNDIPLLELQVTSRSEAGQLADITTIQRVNTRGGVAEGPCPAAGMLLSVPYSADYIFYRDGKKARPSQ
jgi:hypothetical protein